MITIDATVRVQVFEGGQICTTVGIPPGVVLVPGEFVCSVEIPTRDATLGEVARNAYQDTLDFDKVAAAVIEHARKVAGT